MTWTRWAAWAMVLCLAAGSRAADRPNILWITAEDMSRDLGCYGEAYADTPYLDRLAASGTRYTRFFAASPMCAPSRSTLITGMHNNVLGTSQMRSNHRVPDFVRPFTAFLRDAGYYCSNNVKTDYNLSRTIEGGEKPFVREAWDDSSPKAHWRNRPAGKPFFSVFNYMDTHQSRTSRDDYQQFVKNVQSRLPASRIHDPARAPLPPHWPDSPIARRTIARYFDCITTLDDFVGQMLADLKADGLADDTVVIFFSDHGAGLPTGKACASGFGLRCPLIVYAPPKFRHLVPELVQAASGGAVSDRLVCFADMAPSVLRLAGLTPPPYQLGRAFLGTDVEAAPPYVLGSRDRMDETLEATRWISDGKFILIRAFRHDIIADQQSITSWYNGNGELCKEIRAMVKDDKLTKDQRRYWTEQRPPVQMFDLDADPYMLKDLASDPASAARREALESALERFMLQERDLGLWPEPDLADAEKTAPAYDLARNDAARYPLEQLLAVVKLQDVGKLSEKLADAHPLVRYWAVVGLSAAGKNAVAVLPALRTHLKDASASVRIEAASIVARLGDPSGVSEALDVLSRELESDNDFAACRAARSLELLGDIARPKLPEMRRALLDRTTGEFFKNKAARPLKSAGLEFSLMTAMDHFGEHLGDQSP